MRGFRFFIGIVLFASVARAGEAPLIPPAEMQALDRAISRELNSGQMGSQTLGDLYRLKNRLQDMQKAGKSEAQLALEPLDGDDSQRRQLDRLEREAAEGGRAARRSLALYYLFLGEPEKALTQWRLMGKATEHDMTFYLISSYLEFALGEYNSGRQNLETALRFLDSRTSLALSTPVFCDTIAGYRIYNQKPSSSLLPGEDVLVYVEIDGADFGRQQDGGYGCQVMFGLKLQDDTMRVLWAEPNYGEYAPTYSGPIRDLHAALTWRVPNDLAPGRYHLTVEALEDSTKRRGQNVVGFNVERRATNPEKRPTGGLGPTAPSGPPPPALPQSYYDAQKNFPGAPVSTEPPRLGDAEFYKRFDMIQDFHRGQRVE